MKDLLGFYITNTYKRLYVFIKTDNYKNQHNAQKNSNALVSLQLSLILFLLVNLTCPPYFAFLETGTGHFEQTLLGNNYHSKKGIIFA